MPLGVCYYPEHWPEQRWAADAQSMRELGLEWVRIGEFAWALIEPEPGRYDWGWLDRAIDTLAAAGLSVVLGTPTAAPPAWLTAAEPAVLRVGPDGRRLSHGGRRHACVVNQRYRELSQGIVAALAERYGGHPAVAAWQIDNELGHHGAARCYCDSCRAAFHAWLAERYGALAALNEAWGTVFWSQTYSAWEQIPLPADPVGGGHNPALLLDYRRWASAMQVRYCRDQAGLLRQHAPGRPLLTTIAPGDDEIDWFDLAAEVDIIAWDNYPHGFPDWAGVALFHDHMRGLKQAPFWVMEQQPGPVNWTATNPPVPPGQVRLWTYQDAVHGAENVLYFRWRAARSGQEQFHSGLLNHAAQPTRGHAEARQVAEEWATWGQPRAAARKVALLISYEDRWAQQIDPHAAGWSYWRLARIIHRSLLEHGIGVDVLRRGSDLTGYQFAVAVAPTIIDEREAAHWRDWTAAGGTLVATGRTFTKDRDNRWTDQRLPAGLIDFFGAEVVEWTALVPNVPGHLAFQDSADMEIELWAEILRPDCGNPLLTYTAGYAADHVAATACTYGKGMAVLLGFHPSDEVLAELWPRLLPEASRLPLGVEQIALEDGLMLFNHTRYPVEVTLAGTWIDRLTGQTIQGQLAIAELDIRWLQRADPVS